MESASVLPAASADVLMICPRCLQESCTCEAHEALKESNGMKWLSLVTNLPDDPELVQLRQRTGNDVEAILLYIGRLRNRAEGREC